MHAAAAVDVTSDVAGTPAEASAVLATAVPVVPAYALSLLALGEKKPQAAVGSAGLLADQLARASIAGSQDVAGDVMCWEQVEVALSPVAACTRHRS